MQCSFQLSTALLQLAIVWKNLRNSTKYLKLIIASTSVKQPWLCKLRLQIIIFYPIGRGFELHQKHNFFPLFSTYFFNFLLIFILSMSLNYFWTIFDFLFKYTNKQPIVVWHKVFQGLVQGVPGSGTRCSRVWYKVFQGLIQGAPGSGTWGNIWGPWGVH